MKMVDSSRPPQYTWDPGVSGASSCAEIVAAEANAAHRTQTTAEMISLCTAILCDLFKYLLQDWSRGLVSSIEARLDFRRLPGRTLCKESERCEPQEVQ